MSLRSKVATVVDNGLFIELARVLAGSFGKVNYVRPAWLGALPTTADFSIGKVPEVHYVDSAAQVFEETDTFVYPDIYLPHDQRLYARLGKDVWGSRKAEELETLRVKSKAALKNAGVPVKPCLVLKGTSALEDHMRHHKDFWIKADSKTRGDMESHHVKDWAESEEWFWGMQLGLGKARDAKLFMIEQPIEGVELAYDCYTVRGAYPTHCTIGKEEKDRGYVGRFMRYEEIPEPLREVNEKLAPLYKAYGMVNMAPVECIIDKSGTPWAIDPCMRFPSPPTEGLLCQYENWPEIVEAGARGEIVTPKARAQWVAEIVIHAIAGLEGWIALKIPGEIAEWVKLQNFCKIGNVSYVVPQQKRHGTVGGVVGLGDTMEKAIAAAKGVAEKLGKVSSEIAVEPDALDEAEKHVAELKEYGLKL